MGNSKTNNNDETTPSANSQGTELFFKIIGYKRGTIRRQMRVIGAMLLIILVPILFVLTLRGIFLLFTNFG